MIYILDIRYADRLEITKVKPWAVYFTYDNDKYLLHGSTEDYESHIRLYKRIWNGKKYALECISGFLATDEDVEYRFVKYKCKGKVYSQIDKSKFVALLEYYGLCMGYCSILVNRNKVKIAENKGKIKKLQEEIRQLQMQNLELAKFE